MQDGDRMATGKLLVNTLKDFGISTELGDITCGPSVTRYELVPSAGVKISRITGLSDDIALRLATPGVRIEARLPIRRLLVSRYRTRHVVPYACALCWKPLNIAPQRAS